MRMPVGSPGHVGPNPMSSTACLVHRPWLAKMRLVLSPWPARARQCVWSIAPGSPARNKTRLAHACV
eukprot:8105219-Alexandrium_andersonii.AAC.1